MGSRTKKKLVALFGAAMISGLAWGQEPAKDGPAAAPPISAARQAELADPANLPDPVSGGTLGYRLGPVVVYPIFGYSSKYDNNIYSQTTGTGSMISTFKAGGKVEGKKDADVYTLTFTADRILYAKSSIDSVTNYNTLGEATLDFGARLGANLRAQHIDGTDPRGSVPGPIALVPSNYRQNYMGGIVKYGVPGAEGRIELELGYLEKAYLNNRDTTAINDRNATDAGATFFWRVMPKTELLLQAKYTNNSYALAGSTLPSTDERILGGVKWEATAATTGIFKLGRAKKDFKSALQQDYSSTNWDAQIRWSPLSYSTVDFSTGRAARETASALGSSVLGSSYNASWNHAWTSQISSNLTAGYSADTYQGTTRNDKIKNYGAKLTYQFRRWLSFGAEYSISDRDSSDNTADFKRNAGGLFFSVTL